MVRSIACWTAAVLLGVTGLAQETKPTFETASVRPQRDLTAMEGPHVIPGGGFRASRASVQSLLMFAYDLKSYRTIFGGPEWIRRDRFSIDARAGFDASTDQIKQMVQTLLADRFRLISRREQRDMSHLALVVARSDRRLGPFLREVPADCSAAAIAEARKQFPVRPVTGGHVTRLQCEPISALVELLTLGSQLPLLDETKLSGKFTLEMKSSSMVPGSVPTGGDPSVPPLAAALQEQLGLKLESRKGPLGVLVIDSVSPPTEN